MMKKLFFLGMMGAFALTFVACSSEEEVAPVNPTFDGNAVKAEFSINLPGKMATRMQKAITQDANGQTYQDYRLIKADGLFLAPYATPTQSDADPIKVTDSKVGKVELEGDLSINNRAALDKWYNDVTVPVGTNAFLVYAHPDETGGTDAKNGSLTMSAADPFADLANLKFELKTITGDKTGNAILSALNTLEATKGTPYYSTDPALEPVAWSAISADDNQFYAELYSNLISLRAGSKTDVLAFLEELQNVLIENTGDATNGIDVKVKAAVATAIDAVTAADDFTALNGIPDGAAVLKFTKAANATTENPAGFSYVTDEFVNGDLKWGANLYTYPASLWYRANTGIRASNEIQSSNVGTNTWPQFIATLTQADKLVKASTQSVALVNPLQYAVGNFETWIKFAKESYQVDKVETTDEATGEVTVTEEATVKPAELELTGILVGDQKNVDWQFKPLVGTAAAPVNSQVIYDTDLIAKKFNNSDYTLASQILVLETEETKDIVNVALEFVNGSKVPIKGVDGIVPVGAKFYLIGQLKIDLVNNPQTNKNWTAETEGNKKLIFQQDYKTIARFLINDLENTAYNTIPDLRSPELEFGLSVDLKWQKGYEFDINIGSAD